MKTIISRRDVVGEVTLTLEGDASPEAVAREYLKVEEMLFSKPAETEVTVIPTIEIKEKE